MPTLPTTLAVIANTDFEASGLVTQSGLDKLAKNNNYAYATYTGSLGQAVFGSAISYTDSVNYATVAKFPVPESQDLTGLTCYVYCDPGANAANVKLESFSNSSNRSIATLTAGTGAQWVTLTITNTEATRDTFDLYLKGASLTVYSVSLMWRQVTSISSYAVTTAGYRFANDSGSGESNCETATNRPVHDEFLNRCLTNPAILFADRPCALFSAIDNIQGTPRWTVTSGTSRGPVFQALVSFRYPITLDFLAYKTGVSSSWSMTITNETTGNSVSLQNGGAPYSESWGGETWYRSTSGLNFEAGEHLITVSLTAASGTMNLFSLFGFIEGVSE